MQTIPLSELAIILKGKLFLAENCKNLQITHVVTDSRTYFGEENSIFFALSGPVNNGHDYIPQLQKKGLEAFVISEETALKNDAAFILVKDTKKALQNLAAFTRKQFTYPVIGITGSNGKTIVKEWLHDILSDHFKIVRSPKSYNSQVGVPLSVLLISDEYNLGIFEAGISQPGEMENLEAIISPEIGILTNIGDAHQQNFGLKEQKLTEKLLLFKNSKKLVFRADNKDISQTAGLFCVQNKIEQYNWTLQNKDALIRISANQKKNETLISAQTPVGDFNFTIPFTDDSAIENTCHCFATIVAMEENPATFLANFKQLQPVAMRLEIKQGINNCLLINDYYNSDLNSFEIALSVLNQQATKGHNHKQVILSDILQTGIPKPQLYKKVNKLLSDWGINKLTGIGSEIYDNQNEFFINAEFFRSRNDFERQFQKNTYKSSTILIKGARQFQFEKISALLQQKAHQTVLEINMNALIHNLNTFRGLLKPETKIVAMVKAFSYGSGDVEVARLLEHQNIDYLAVAVADEGVLLRNAGILTPIIVMNPEQESFQNMVDYKLEPNIYSLELLKNFARTVSENGVLNFPIHLKLDTGMNRLGLKTMEETEPVIQYLQTNNLLKVQSVFSHLATSDEPEMDAFTHSQFEKFDELSATIVNAFPYKIDRHILNSAGIERFPEKQFEMVRLGIGLYGISQTGLALENIGTLKSTISQVKTVTPEETVGYSRKGHVEKPGKIAVVPMGYADGLDRKLGNGNGFAFVNGKFAPIIGNICMDMLMLDVTGINASPGDMVEFFGPHISITELADKVGTIPYEILTGISQRVKRVYLQE